MKLSSIRNLGPALAVISALSSAAWADQPQQASLIQPLPSAFAGLNWSVGDVPLGIDFETAMEIASPSTRLMTRRWVAKRVSRNQDPIAPHDDYQQIGFNVTATRGVNDRIVIEPTHWHTGSMVWEVNRTVKSSQPELMPTADDLVAAAIATYGADPKTGNRITGAGGVTQQSQGTLSYPVKNGARHQGRCFEIGMRIARNGAPPRMEYEAAKKLVADIRDGDLCDGVLVVLFAKGNFDRLREYQVIARDFLMEAQNIVHDYETRIRLLEEHQNSLPSVAPEL